MNMKRVRKRDQLNIERFQKLFVGYKFKFEG